MSLHLQFHESQFPEQVKADLHQSLRERRMAQKFHYDSYKQAAQWLRLHQAYAPQPPEDGSRNIYDQAFAQVAEHAATSPGCLIGLGCGGGEKEAALLEKLGSANVDFLPVDVSAALVMRASLASGTSGSSQNSGHRPAGLVCDLSKVEDWSGLFDSLALASPRVLTFFGMLPNFPPQEVFPKLNQLLRPGDTLVLNANLAPGPEYEVGVKKVLPQYNNPLTHRWLATVLLDLGLELVPDDIQWRVGGCPSGEDLLRLNASVLLNKTQTIWIEDVHFDFSAGEPFDLFYSYRYTMDRLQALLGRHGLTVEGEWILPSKEEAVLVCSKAS